MMNRVMLTGLVEIVLPSRTIRLCDGGFVIWGENTFSSSDDEFGTLGGFEALSEGVGDEAPAGTLTMLPASTAAAAVLSQPGYQGSPVRLWIAEVDEETGHVVETPDQQGDWQLDRTTLRIGRGTRALEMGCVTRAQRLLARNEGNVLSSAFHSRIFPGERGHDNAVGLQANFAWGVASPPRGVVASGTVG
jgi:hypothetical protein